jgi:hypothetical protein
MDAGAKLRGFELVWYGSLVCLIAVLGRDGTAMAESSSSTTRAPIVSKVADCPGGSLNDCFTSSDQMGQYLEIVRPLLT